MKIIWFGHSCFRIDTGASSILIDPFLTFNQTFENSGIPLHQAIKGVTHVALTHGHEDHTGDTVTICKDTGAPLLAVHELATFLAGEGVDKIDPGNTGGTLYHKDFDLTFVPAWHSASRMIDGRPLYLGACCGLVIAPKQGKTVYHMGDTAIFADMALIAETLCAEGRFRADRRPLYDGRQDRGARLQALLQVRDHRALPLRDLPGARSDR